MIEFDLSGRAGVVTGAGKGIGEAVALELAGLGAKLVCCARTQADIDRVVARITAAGGTAVGFSGDVRRFDDMERLARTCVDAYGKIDFAVPNAGIDIEGNMCDADPADWQRMIDTNVLGTAYIIRATLPYMRAQNDGHIVVMASISGRVTYVGEPMYIASKWAIAGMAGALRKEALAYGVRVTQIEPGLVDTPHDPQPARGQGRPRQDPGALARAHRLRGRLRARPAPGGQHHADPDPAARAGLLLLSNRVA